MKTTLDSLAEDLFQHFERSRDEYLVQVFSEYTGTYEWMPVNEELAELLFLLEGHINGERKNRSKRPYPSE